MEGKADMRASPVSERENERERERESWAKPLLGLGLERFKA